MPKLTVYLQPIEIEVDEQTLAEYGDKDDIAVMEVLLGVGEKLQEMGLKAIHHTVEEVGS